MQLVPNSFGSVKETWSQSSRKAASLLQRVKAAGRALVKGYHNSYRTPKRGSLGAKTRPTFGDITSKVKRRATKVKSTPKRTRTSTPKLRIVKKRAA
jgi:hypothetical protein